MAKRREREATELPFRQLDQYWNWLPAFRAVAETGGVNEAARQLHLSPSALSRSVSLLEAALGEPLFHRSSGFALTLYGESLLEATREAMRRIHEATRESAALDGPLRVGATSRLAVHRLMPALRAMCRERPEVEPSISSLRATEVEALLLRGALDAAVVIGTHGPRSLAGTLLAPARSRVYCGKGHPLFAARRASAAAIEAHPFAAPIATDGGAVTVDAWPADRPRKIALRSDTLDPAIDACLQGELLVCLPDEIVSALGLGARLRALPEPKLPTTPLLYLMRPPIGPRTSLAQKLLERLAESEP